MKKSSIVLAAVLFAGLLLRALPTHPSESPPLEVKAVFPGETSPGKYRQVDAWELQRAAEEGWELVSVMPYVYMNEERGDDTPKHIVTQTYPAYFFKRTKVSR